MPQTPAVTPVKGCPSNEDIVTHVVFPGRSWAENPAYTYAEIKAHVAKCPSCSNVVDGLRAAMEIAKDADAQRDA